MDKDTRNRLQKATQAARGLLEQDFEDQLAGVFDIQPDGIIGDAPGDHLDDTQKVIRRKLLASVAHLQANGQTAAEAVASYRREAVFTTLNRFVALKMLEARGLVQECISRGEQSSGFKEFRGLAPGLVQLPDRGYRLYLECLFDEIGREVRVLFDRREPASLLWPGRQTLIALLEILNGLEGAGFSRPNPEPGTPNPEPGTPNPEPGTPNPEPGTPNPDPCTPNPDPCTPNPDPCTPNPDPWSLDETIGWVYQYFNTKDERKAMRDASQAPRNSRELAVRNQFFTPRYVVEFLVDNTLGRLWFNATGGRTALRERCRYLLAKPDEAPQASTQPRDPRTLKLLDPACGSMHFGLYAFDVFAEIYREAWTWEQRHGPGSLDVSTQPEAGLKPLSQTYEDAAAFLRDVPRLIIEHNIHGVDIDPRAAQIASLALWLRAQRAWHEAGIKSRDRPSMGMGHVVAAIAPPAEESLREQFAAGLDHLDRELFEKTLRLLKGLPELGVLLQVERELPRLIREVYGEHGPIFREIDAEQWRKAEDRLRQALTAFAEAANATYQGRLFAQDALQGLRLIDLVRETFDVVVMNPPFGALSHGVKDSLAKAYPSSRNDLLAIFVERSLELLRQGGRIGAITSRTCFFLSSFQKWREHAVLGIAEPEVLADLGHGVMDDAMVEAAAYVLSKK